MYPVLESSAREKNGEVGVIVRVRVAHVASEQDAGSVEKTGVAIVDFSE